MNDVRIQTSENDAKGSAVPGPHGYLTAAELKQLRTQLLGMRDFALQRDMETSEIDADTADPSDRATIEEDTRRTKAYAAHKRALLASVDAALERMQTGEYGYCLETGEPIGFQRLAANPIATLSIEAQERLERRQRTTSVTE